MKAFSEEIIKKIQSMPDDKREIVLDGLARLYAVRPHRASEEFKEKGPLPTEVEAEVSP